MFIPPLPHKNSHPCIFSAAAAPICLLSQRTFGNLKDSALRRVPSAQPLAGDVTAVRTDTLGAPIDFKKKPKFKSTWHALVLVTIWNADR